MNTYKKKVRTHRNKCNFPDQHYLAQHRHVNWHPKIQTDLDTFCLSVSKTENCRVFLLVDCPFLQNSKCPTDVILCSAGTASVQQIFHSILLEQQVSNKCSTLFWLNGKCQTSIPLYSAGTASVQQLLHSVLVERQVSTNISRYSGGKANVQQVSHSVLLQRQVSNKCPTLFYWNGKCPTSVPLFISQGPIQDVTYLRITVQTPITIFSQGCCSV